MTNQPGDPVAGAHPHLVFLRRVDARLEELDTVPVWSMTPAEQREALVLSRRVRSRSEAIEQAVLAEADRGDTCTSDGATDAAAWVAVETRQTIREAKADLKLAKAMDERYQLVAVAMGAGAVNTAQARVITRALDLLPDTGRFAVSVEQRVEAETWLVDQAAHHDAKALRVLGARIFEVICPDLAEEHDGRALEAEEAQALRRTRFSMWEDDEGTCHGRFRIPLLHGHMLRKFLQAFTNPGRPQDSGIDPDLPSEVREGHAFTQLLEQVPAGWAPRHGGCTATVVVTMTLEQLLARLDKAGVCTLDTGGRISASEARRLACAAGIIPMVLGGKSQPLDIGRRGRFHTEAQRTAMGVRDGGCTAQHCEVPASMCHAHHDHPWSQGGTTSLATGRLLCGHHHRRIHDPRFAHERLPNGKISFHRRT